MAYFVSNLQFSKGIDRFDLNLRGDLVVVRGFSGQGKTFCYKILEMYRAAMAQDFVKGLDLRRLELINVFTNPDPASVVGKLAQCSGKFIVIDNADAILTDEIASKIGQDWNNQYLIFSRSLLSFHISPNYYAQMRVRGGLHTLHYEYSVEGWF